MKKIIISLFLAAVLVISGCGTVSDNESSAPGTEETVASAPESSAEDSATQSEVSMEIYKPRTDSDGNELSGEIVIDKTEYRAGERVEVKYSGTDEKDWVGFYAGSDEPGTVNSIVWAYSVGSGTLYFNVNSIGEEGYFTAFLCDNDGYAVIDKVTIRIIGSDTNNYGAKSVSASASRNANGISTASVTVTPGTDKEVEYRICWAKDGKVLEGYEPLFTLSHSGLDPFTCDLNDGFYMPDEADGVCVAVRQGDSALCCDDFPEGYKLTKSKHLYDFAVITDLHINLDRSSFTEHLKLAMRDIKTLYPECAAIFTVGDNTDNGYDAQYELLMDTIASCNPDAPLYFTIGNHDLMYGTDYDEQVRKFMYYTGMSAPYYSFEMNGNKCIVLASDSLDGNGTMGKTEMDWLASQLAECDKNDRIFLFVHQPLIETVSGSLYSRDHEIQDWYGFYNSGNSIHSMLSEYPNAMLFTGHTHWTLESIQPILIGAGKDANFVNCASVGYLWTDLDAATGGSEGIFVEVYEDYILVRGREFLNGNWCAALQIVIPRIG